MRKPALVALGASTLLLLAACGGGASGGESSSSAPAGSGAAGSSTSGGSSAAASPAAAGLVTSYQNAQPAVIQLDATGEFLDVGASAGQQGEWMGSGFIIDPSGIAVTNAHVAEGAATLKAYVGGSKEPVNAKILGISECDDLAVIDLEGDGYSYVKWSDGGPAAVTTKVWAAGFPLGDPQYTVTDGSIAKNNADGQREWASLDYTYESTAPIQHGNSGGPLLAEDGTVVGVNYAGGSSGNTDQFWAIPATLAKPIVDILKTGKDTDSIGVNGEAFYDDKSQLGGIWVSGVRSGSPASEAGLQPGDIITQMEGRDVVTNSDVDTSGGIARVTKQGYCDILKTQGETHPIKVQVFRASTGEVLEGEVNNADKPLVAVSAINNSTGTAASDNGSSSSTGDVTWTTLTDDSGTFSADVPSIWSDTSTSGNEIIAAVNGQDFTNGNSTGIDIYVSDGAVGKKNLKSAIKQVEANSDVNKILATCKNSEAGKVTDGDGYSYLGDSFWGCQGSDLSYYLSIRTYPTQDKSVVVLGQFTTDQDVQFVNRSLASLQVK